MKKVELVFFALCLCANVFYMYTNDLSGFLYILFAVLAWLTASALHLAAHELGHLAGGLLSGYKLVLISLGPLALSYDPGRKGKVRIEKSRGGQCVMEPKKITPCRYRRYNYGGIAGNLVLVFASGLLVPVAAHIAYMLLIDLVCVGLMKIVVNCIPSIAGGVPNDAYVVRLLSGNEWVQKDYCVYLKLYGALLRDEEIDAAQYRYNRPLNVSENELLYYREIQSILEETENASPR